MSTSSLSLLAAPLLTMTTASLDLFSIDAPSSITWFEANSLCNSSSTRGQLASSHSSDDDAELSVSCSSGDCWIGLSRHSGSSLWLWKDETTTDYTNPTFDLSLPLASQSCAALSTGPIWMEVGCLSTEITTAICSECGYEDQYCCTTGTRCNSEDLICRNSICVPDVSTTTIDPTSYHLQQGTAYTEWHKRWALEIALVLILPFIIGVGLCSWIRQKQKRKQLERERAKPDQLSDTDLELASNDQVAGNNAVSAVPESPQLDGGDTSHTTP